jgi:serine/threonine protein kinase
MDEEFDCNMKLLKVLGSGVFGVVYQYKTQCIIKIEKVSTIPKSEFECLKIVYNKLHKILPFHVIQPISSGICEGKNWNINILNELLKIEINKINRFKESYPNLKAVYPTISDIKKESYEFMIMDNLGDCTLSDLLNKSPNITIFKEIIFQLIIFLLYLLKYTKITHNDIHYGNIVLKKTNKTLNYLYKFGNKICRLTISPKYLAYFIDFGQCSNSDLIVNEDFISLWSTFERSSQAVSYKYELDEFLMKYYRIIYSNGSLEELEKILKDRFFKDIVTYYKIN